MFKQGEKVIYPRYGLTKINRVYKEMLTNTKEDYYELRFSNNLLVSIPAKNAEKLGLRYPMNSKMLTDELKMLTQAYTIPEELLGSYNDFMTDLLATGMIPDAINVIRLYKQLLIQTKDQPKQPLNSTREIYLEAVENVKTEIKAVLGEQVLPKYKI